MDDVLVRLDALLEGARWEEAARLAAAALEDTPRDMAAEPSSAEWELRRGRARSLFELAFANEESVLAKPRLREGMALLEWSTESGALQVHDALLYANCSRALAEILLDEEAGLAEAMSLLDRCLDINSRHGGQQGLGHTLELLGLGNQIAGYYDTACDRFMQATEVFEHLAGSDSDEEVRDQASASVGVNLLRAADCKRQVGDYPGAHALCDRVEPAGLLATNVLSTRVRILIAEHRFDDAREVANAGARLAGDDAKNEARFLVELGVIRERQGDREAAHSAFVRSKELAPPDEWRMRFDILRGLALTSDGAAAWSLMDEAIAIAQAHAYRIGFVITHIDRARAHIDRGERTEHTFDHYVQAARILDEIGNHAGAEDVLDEMIRESTGTPTGFELSALVLQRSLDTPAGRAAAAARLEQGQHWLAAEAPDKARPNLLDALKRFERLRDFAGCADACRLIARCAPTPTERARYLAKAIEYQERNRRHSAAEVPGKADLARWDATYAEAVDNSLDMGLTRQAVEQLTARQGRLLVEEAGLSDEARHDNLLAGITDFMTPEEAGRWRQIETEVHSARSAAEAPSIADPGAVVTQSGDDWRSVDIDAWQRLCDLDEERWRLFATARRRQSRARRPDALRRRRFGGLQADVNRRRAALVTFAWSERRQAALVMAPGATDPVVVVLDGARVRSALRDWEALAFGDPTNRTAIPRRDWELPLERLRQHLWRPIAIAAHGLPVIVAPDPAIAHVPWGWLSRGYAPGLVLAPAPGLFRGASRTGCRTRGRPSLFAVGASIDNAEPGVEATLARARHWPGRRTVAGTYDEPARALIQENGKYDVLLVASHYRAAGDERESGLVLASRGQGEGPVARRLLSVPELLRLGVSARSVVLLGCSALSPAAGPEMLSVAAAIQVATGADQILASVVPVSSLGAFLLWAELERDLARGASIAATVGPALTRLANGLAPERSSAYLGRLLAPVASAAPRQADPGLTEQPLMEWAIRTLATRQRPDADPLFADLAAWVVVSR